MKKLLSIALCIALLSCLFTGCGRNEDTQNTDGSTSESTGENTTDTQLTTQPTTVRPTEAPTATMPSMTTPNPTEMPSTVAPDGGVEDETHAGDDRRDRSKEHKSTGSSGHSVTGNGSPMGGR